MKCFKFFVGFVVAVVSWCLVALVEISVCDNEILGVEKSLEEDTEDILGDENAIINGTRQEIVSETAIKRILDLNSSPNNTHSQSKLLENTLKNVDFGILLKSVKDEKKNDGEWGRSVKSSTSELERAKKSNNIQKVAKRQNAAIVANRENAVDRLDRIEGFVEKSGSIPSTTNNFNRSNSNGYSGDSNSDVRWLKRIFNVLAWQAENIPAYDRMSDICAARMFEYLKALHNRTVWADRMADSTGRYSSQFFFGNDFWLGSRTECRELQNKDYNKIVPPFPVHFYVSKFTLQLENKGHSYNRLLSIGLCLPKECSTTDIKMILEEDAKLFKSINPSRLVNVLSVRAVPSEYSIFADKKLHLVLVILSTVIALAIIGSFYEISLKHKRNVWHKKHRASVITNNNEGDVKIITPLENLHSIELTLNSEYQSTKNNNNLTTAMEHAFTQGESKLSQLILSFSVISNSEKILYIGSTPEESLTCVHGLRFLSLAWVIMVHTYLQVFTIAENKALRKLAERNFMFQTVSNATFSVDTFFFISGLLVTYLYFKSARKEINDKGRRSFSTNWVTNLKKFFKLVGYRFLRLTPAYMFVLLIAEISMRWIHNWSVFEPQSQNHVSCDKYWWRNILYINSLYPMKDMCMLWSWYVSNDTQFYILGIIILLLSIRYFRLSAMMLFLSLVISWAVTISISLYYDYRAKIDDPFLLFDELYDKPWTRLGPYLIGMFAGWFIFKTKCKLNVSKITVIIGWFLSIFTLLALVYGLHLYPLAAVGSALYVSVGHSAWGAALAWIVIACCSGYGGFIDSFLSFKLLHPLSRLTYCAYLVHPIIMTTTNFQMNAPLHLQDSIVIILYFGNILASFIASFCISLLFEAPVVRLLKILFSPQSRQSVKTQTNL
ncbi:hypothetical protein PGB90_002890 [Kerria lacca]